MFFGKSKKSKTKRDGLNRNYVPLTTGIVAWYDASELQSITKDGSNKVSAWKDKSGNGYHLSQGTGTAQPTWQSGQLGGKATLNFDGSDWFSLNAGLYTIPNGDNTVVVVTKRTSEDASIDTVIGMATAGSNNYFHIFSATAGVQSFKNRTGVAGTVSVTGLTNTNYNVTICRRTGTTQGIETNNGGETTNTSAQSDASIDEGWIGCATANTLPLIGDVAEIIIYNRLLSTFETTRLFRYINKKWGIAVS